MRFIVPTVVCIALPACLALADLLVTPGNASALHAHTAVFPPRPAGGGGFQEAWFVPRGFGSGGSIMFGPTDGNQVSGGSGYNDTFFFVFPTGVVNTAIIHGNADVSAQVRSADPVNLTATGYSSSSVDFTVTTAVAFHLYGSVSLSNVAGSGAGFGSAYVDTRLVRSGNPIPGGEFILNTYSANTLTIDLSGTLNPGNYELNGYASASATATAASSLWSSSALYNAQIDFSPIPAPGGVGVLALSTIGLARRTRPRR